MRTKEEVRQVIKDNWSDAKPADNQKRRFWGQHRRHLLLAYAYVRGRPYRSVELRIRKDNQVSVSALSEICDAPVDLLRVWLAAPPPKLVVVKDQVARGLQYIEKDRRRKQRERLTALWSRTILPLSELTDDYRAEVDRQWAEFVAEQSRKVLSG